jgi:hypothetical protein
MVARFRRPSRLREAISPSSVVRGRVNPRKPDDLVLRHVDAEVHSHCASVHIGQMKDFGTAFSHQGHSAS